MLAGFGTKWVKKVFLTVTPITCTFLSTYSQKKRNGMALIKQNLVVTTNLNVSE